jgi:hypothetical protein
MIKVNSNPIFFVFFFHFISLHFPLLLISLCASFVDLMCLFVNDGRNFFFFYYKKVIKTQELQNNCVYVHSWQSNF